MNDYYAILGIHRDADVGAIRVAYRELARQLHPDRNADIAAHEQFKAVNEAYRVLSDPATRARYDRFGLRPDGSVYGAVALPVAPSGFADIARAVARGVRRAVRPRGSDITIEVKLSPFDLIRGARRVFSLPRRRRDHSIEMRRIEFVLPPLLRPGQRLSWKGEGAPADEADLPPGNLWVHVLAAPDEHVAIDGFDLRVALPLRPSQSLFGHVATVESAEGSMQLTIAPRSRHGERVVVPGRGLPRPNQSRGDLVFELHVHWPDNPTQAVRDALQQWEESSLRTPKL